MHNSRKFKIKDNHLLNSSSYNIAQLPSPNLKFKKSIKSLKQLFLPTKLYFITLCLCNIVICKLNHYHQLMFHYLQHKHNIHVEQLTQKNKRAYKTLFCLHLCLPLKINCCVLWFQFAKENAFTFYRVYNINLIHIKELWCCIYKILCCIIHILSVTYSTWYVHA